MLLPTSHLATLAVIVFSMLCLGLWANTYKLAGKWRFELYYFDFAIGVFAAAVVAALTVGTLGFDGFSFTDDLLHASKKQDLQGFLSGLIFNLGNMLLVAAIGIAGMGIAFPVAMGVALAIGTLWVFALRPAGNPAILFSGAVILLAAVFTAAYAYRYFRLGQLDEMVKTGQLKSTRKVVSLRGVVLALVSGVFLGSFLPLLESSQYGDAGLGPYGEGFVFAAGILFSTFLYNLFFMNLPVAGPPLEILDYFKSALKQHFMGLAGGIVWFLGMLLGLVGSRAEGAAAVAPTTIFATSQFGAVIAALCGVLVWREFQGSDGRVRALIFVVLALFICGLGMISIAPVWTRT